jgi:ABC-type multidrug transport system ATPase subunit
MPSLPFAHRAALTPPPDGVAVVATEVSKLFGPPEAIFDAPVPIFDRLFRRDLPPPTAGVGDEFVDDDDDGADDALDVAGEPVGVEEWTPSWALRDVSFTVPAGATVGVVGPTGSGKTTLLRIIGGTTYPTAGRIEIHGSVTPTNDFLSWFVREDASPRQNLVVLAKALGQRRNRLLSMSDAIFQISSSRQTLGVAATVYSDNDVLLLDEPLTGLSNAGQEALLRRMEALSAEQRTLLVATSDTELARELCTHVLVLDGGQLVQAGPPADVLSPAPSQPRRRRGSSTATLRPDWPESVRAFNKRAAIIGTAVVHDAATRTVTFCLDVETAGFPVTASAALGLVGSDGHAGVWLDLGDRIPLEPNGRVAFTCTVDETVVPEGPVRGRAEFFIGFGDELSTIGRYPVFHLDATGWGGPIASPQGGPVRYGVVWTLQPSDWSVRSVDDDAT